MKRIQQDGLLWYESQREILHMLQATPLTMRELAELRGVLQPPTWQALNHLEEQGYVMRFGKLRHRCSWADVWHWTGKNYPRLPASVHASELQCRALSLPEQVKRFALAEELTARMEKHAHA